MWVLTSKVSDMIRVKSESEAREWIALLLNAGETVTIRFVEGLKDNNV